jgi:hypothetical protein
MNPIKLLSSVAALVLTTGALAQTPAVSDDVVKSAC